MAQQQQYDPNYYHDPAFDQGDGAYQGTYGNGEYGANGQQPVYNPYAPQNAYQPTQPQQGQGTNPNEELFSETFGTYTEDPMTGMAVKYGAQVMGQKFGDVHGKFNMYLSFLKYYFDVDTAYVAKKLRIVLMPFSNMTWRRIRVQEETTGELSFASPREDVNAPDLYIPTMAFVTLVLLVGFSMGVLSNKFHPEVLGTTASTALICITFEAVLFKLGFFLISSDYVPPFLDIIAYCGYVFVSVVVNLTIGMFFNSLIYHICTLLTSFMIGIFLVRSMRDFLLVPGSVSGDKRRQVFLFVIVITQVLIAWFMGSLADWSTSHPEFLQNVVHNPMDIAREIIPEPEEEGGILTNTAVM